MSPVSQNAASGHPAWTAAVYMSGENLERAAGAYAVIGAELAKALSKGGHKVANRTEDIRKLLAEEHGGDTLNYTLDNAQIKTFGEWFSVDYMCAVEMKEVSGNSYYMEARMVDAATGETVSTATAASGLSNSVEMATAAREMAAELIGALGSATASAPQMPVQEASPVPVVQETAPPDLPEQKTGMRTNSGLGIIFANSFGEKVELKQFVITHYISGWSSWYDTTSVLTYKNKPYKQGLGISSFSDLTYVGIAVQMFFGNETWSMERRRTSTDSVVYSEEVDAFFMSASLGVFGRYPIAVSENITWFPVAGIYYGYDICSEFMSSAEYEASDRAVFGGAFEAVQFKFGAGLDVALSKALFLRSEALYSIGIPIKGIFGGFMDESYSEIKKSGLPQGLTVRVSLGWWKSIGK